MRFYCPIVKFETPSQPARRSRLRTRPHPGDGGVLLRHGYAVHVSKHRHYVPVTHGRWHAAAHTKERLARLEKRLRARKRRLSRCQSRSGNRKRCKRKVALTYARIDRIREHAMQAIAHAVVDGVDAVVIEGFNPHNLCGGRLGNG